MHPTKEDLLLQVARVAERLSGKLAQHEEEHTSGHGETDFMVWTNNLEPEWEELTNAFQKLYLYYPDWDVK